ncbi:hypothetical protein NCAS_0D00110 [Naumovozyma castellii]|uniref:Uncharacterized protein n=1 Tax=Naumovozyma castellii TaxID=27288 RepID=G0VEX3_NAUCA|nr:hypothetical protein NCAS_0D00110 [Naumovozyma castellii CBS 4309]CCC69592.1 hypothetical protein NCAS_0D00110 [Naumovozyma castellii CBS 4309]
MASAFLGQTKKNRIYNWAKFHSLKPHSLPFPSHQTTIRKSTTTMFYISDNVSVVDGFVVLTIERRVLLSARLSRSSTPRASCSCWRSAPSWPTTPWWTWTSTTPPSRLRPLSPVPTLPALLRLHHLQELFYTTQTASASSTARPQTDTDAAPRSTPSSPWSTRTSPPSTSISGTRPTPRSTCSPTSRSTGTLCTPRTRPSSNR